MWSCSCLIVEIVILIRFECHGKKDPGNRTWCLAMTSLLPTLLRRGPDLRSPERHHHHLVALGDVAGPPGWRRPCPSEEHFLPMQILKMEMMAVVVTLLKMWYFLSIYLWQQLPQELCAARPPRSPLPYNAIITAL